MLSHLLWSSMFSSSVSVIIGSWVSYMALCSLKWAIAVPVLCASLSAPAAYTGGRTRGLDPPSYVHGVQRIHLDRNSVY